MEKEEIKQIPVQPPERSLEAPICLFQGSIP
jgi:hypothetical protein